MGCSEASSAQVSSPVASCKSRVVFPAPRVSLQGHPLSGTITRLDRRRETVTSLCSSSCVL